MKALLLSLFWVTGVNACDLCSTYCPCDDRQPQRGFFAGVFGQFTHFSTLQENGHRVSNPADQKLDSSITQFLVGYQVVENFSVQFTTPFLYRHFRRPGETGSESGIGDASLVANYRLFKRATDDWTLMLNVLAGIKFPTGDSDRLREELVEIPTVPESGIHGHDLALGSGSYDGIVGGSVYGRWKRLFANAAVLYSIRSEGDFNYRYANDLTWNGGPGVLLWLDRQGSLGLQCNISGESKGNDRGAEDTAISSVYLGPELSLTWTDKLMGEFGVDLPVFQNNTALQIVPDYRLHAAITYRF